MTAPAIDLRTASAAAIIAHGRQLRENETKPITGPDLFVHFAGWAMQHTGDEQTQDLVLDLVDALTPHLSSEQSADWWHELKTALVRHQLAEAGDVDYDELHPDEANPDVWAQKCRAAVDEAAHRLAGVA